MEKRIKRIGNNVGVMFIGDWLIDYYNDNKLKEEIHRKADIELRSIVLGNKSFLTLDKALLVSLIIIAMENYDSKFYEYLQEYYVMTFSEDVSEQTIYNKVREAIRKVYSVNNHDNSRIINSILVDSFVPLKYLADFYDFIFDILNYNYDFVLDFDKESEDEITEELKVLFHHLFTEDNFTDNYNISYESKVKTYKLITSTRLVLSNESYSDAIIPVVIHMMKILHADYYDLPIIELLQNDYYKYGYNQWIKNNENRIKVKNNVINDGLNTVPRIIRFNYATRKAIILTKRHFINEESNKELVLELINNGNVVYTTSNLVVKNVLGGVRIDPYVIETEFFIGELSYRITCNNAEIYNSGNIISRDVLVFKSDGELLKRNNEYRGNIFVATDRTLNNEEFRHEKIPNGNLYLGYKEEDTQLDFGTSQLIFQDVKNDQLIGEKVENVISFVGNKEIDLYRSLKRIILASYQLDSKELILRVNNHELINIPIDKVQESNDGVNRYTIVNLDFFDLIDGHHRLEILDANEQLITKFEFLLDWKCIYQEKFNAEEGMKITLQSSFFNKIEKSISINCLKENRIEKLEHNFKYGLNVYKYKTNFSFPYYEMNDELYNHRKYIWLDDINKQVVLHSTDTNSYSFLVGRHVSTQNYVDGRNPIVITKSQLNDLFNKNGVDYLEIILTSTKRPPTSIKVLQRNILENNMFNIYKEGKQYIMEVNYDGKNPVNILLKKDGNILFDSSISKQSSFKMSLIQDTKYEVTISEGSDSFFSEIPYKVLHHTNFIDYSLKGICRNNFLIVGGYENAYSRISDITDSYITNVRQLDNHLIGDLVVKRRMGYQYMDMMNPVKIELLDSMLVVNNDEKSTFAAHIVDRDDDGIIFDPKHGSIHNSEVKSLPAVDRFVLKLRGE